MKNNLEDKVLNAVAVRAKNPKTETNIKRINKFFNNENIFKNLKRMMNFLIPKKDNVKLKLNIGGGSFTDGESITVGVPEILLDRSLPEIYSALQALIGHESQHINSSDFKAFVQFQKDIGDYFFTKYNIPKGYGMRIGKHIFNSIEDGRIEKILCTKLPGYKKHIQFLNGTFWELQPLKGNSELEDFLYSITSFSVTGLYPKGFKDIYKGTELHQNMRNIEKDIYQGIDAITCKQCVMVCHDIILKVEPYLAKLLENRSQEDQEFMDNLPSQNEWTTSEESEHNSSDTVTTHFVPKKNKKEDKEEDKEENNEEEKKNQNQSDSKDDSDDSNDEGDSKSEETNKSSDDDDSKKDSAENSTDGTKDDGSEKDDTDEKSEGNSTGESDKEEADNEESDGNSTGESDEEESDNNEETDGNSKGKSDEDETDKEESDGNSKDESDKEESQDSLKGNSDDESSDSGKEDNSEEDKSDDEDSENNKSKDSKREEEIDSDSNINSEEHPEGVNQEDADFELDEDTIREQMKAISDEAIEEAEKKMKEAENNPSQKDKSSKKDEDSKLTQDELKEINDLYRNQYEKNFKEVKGFNNNHSLPVEIKNEGSRFRKEVEKIFRNKETYNLRAQKKGVLDTGNLWKFGVKDYNIFMKKGAPITTDYVAFVLQDGSGSMRSNHKEFYSAKAMSVMEEGLKGIIPLKVSTFSVERSTVIHYTAKDWKDNSTTHNYSYNFHRSRTASGGNKDGYSIRVATAELMKRPEKDRILIILSDGLPSDYNGGEAEGILDVKEAVKEARKKGIHVVSIIFGTEQFREENIQSYKTMYDRNIISCEPEMITNNLIKMLKKIISR